MLNQPPEIGDPPRIDLTTTDTDDGGTSWRDKLSSRSGTVGSAIGSGGVSTTVDPDTGRASQSITGTGATTPESDEGNIDVGVTGPSASLPDLRGLEQTVEDTTGGAAFGDPNEQETIDENTSRTTAGGSTDNPIGASLGGAIGESDGFGVATLVAAAVAVVALMSSRM